MHIVQGDTAHTPDGAGLAEGLGKAAGRRTSVLGVSVSGCLKYFVMNDVNADHSWFKTERTTTRECFHRRASGQSLRKFNSQQA